MQFPPKHIILSRTDGIGDMLLMLPMAGVLKQYFPHTKISILGKAYTKALVDACVHADAFIDEKDFFAGAFFGTGEKPDVFINVRTNKADAKRAKQLHIPLRIGTTSRWYHWLTCNRLVKLNRKNASLHEAQLNMKLLRPLGIGENFSLATLETKFGLENLQSLSPANASLISPDKYNIIIHPKSQGSSREWPLDHFVSLVNLLDENRFQIFLSGVEKEKVYVEEIIQRAKKPVISLAGKMPLDQFLPFIKACDGIVANATGPIHLGAALGIDAFGLYPPIRPLHPGRWSPPGPKAQVFVTNKDCSDCRHNKDACHCMNEILPVAIAAAVNNAAAAKLNS